MRAINPFLVLGLDETASRAEIDAAHRELIVENHPDHFATASARERERAAARTAEINEAHLLLTDRAYAARNKRKFDRVRAAGIPVEPAPQRGAEGTAAAQNAGTPAAANYREVATTEFNVSEEREATPWVAPRRRRRFGRR